MPTVCDKFQKKIDINKNKNIYLIFYNKWCFYCMDAFKYLKDKKKSYKGYDIDNIKGGIDYVLKCSKKNKEKTGFNPAHKTKPIIFYKGKFIGGFFELKKLLDG